MFEHLYGHIQVQLNGRAGIDAPTQDDQKEKPSVKRRRASPRAGTPRKRKEFETEPPPHAASSSSVRASAPSRPSTAFDDEDASSLSSDSFFDASLLFDEEGFDPASNTKSDQSKPKDKKKKDKKNKPKKKEKNKKEKKQEKKKNKSKG